MKITPEEIKAILENEGIKKAIAVVEGLSVEWIAHMLMFHGFIHHDRIAVAASLRATEWLGDNPPGGKHIPEILACALANVIVYTGFTFERLAELSTEQLMSLFTESMEKQDSTDYNAEKMIASLKHKISLDEFMSNPNFGKSDTTH